MYGIENTESLGLSAQYIDKSLSSSYPSLRRCSIIVNSGVA